jgi:PAS domain S-box-containing protein
MSSKRSRPTEQIQSEQRTNDTAKTIQLLVSDRGNRTVIREMLSDHFCVETEQEISDADLYLIEDHLFSDYHEALQEQVKQAHPTFCPVVLIRRETTELAHPASDEALNGGPLLIDDVVNAPIDRSLLIRRLHSLIVRRSQSQELSSRASALSDREQELRKFERGVESTGNGIVMVDRFGEIEYANPAVEKITGYTASEILGETPRVLPPAGAADVFTEDFWQTIIERKEWEGETVIERRDETRSVVDTSITAIHDDTGDVEGFIIVLNDITARIQQEQELQSREQELDHLRQILTRYLRHNLRNDLNVIQGYADMLSSSDTLSDDQVWMAETIVRMAQRLQQKSDTARQFSELSQKGSALELYDLSEIVRECIQTVKKKYSNVAFETDVPSTCDIRAQAAVRDAIEELIENAAQHNDATSPRVTVKIQETHNTRLIIEDNGPGISELEVETLKEGKETPLSHSQGFGLWMSKWAIESVDGELSFDLLDQGTRVIVDFPSLERIGSDGLDIPSMKERDERLQTVINRMTDAIIEVSPEWEITFVDTRAEKILNVSADEIHGKRFWDVFSDARDTRFESVYREAMDSRTSQHVESYYPGIDGWLSSYVYPEFDGGLSFYFRETTERNRHEQALQQAQSRMEIALNVTDSTVWEWDAETDSVTTHPDPHAAFGTKIATGCEFLDAIHPDDREQVDEALQTALETGTVYTAEYRVQRDGDTRWVEDYGEPRQDTENSSKRLIGVARDITERKERRRRYEAIFNQTYQFTGLMKPDGTLVEANDTALEFGGISRDDVIGQKVWNAYWFEISEETQAQTKADVQRAADGEFVRRELEVQGADGTAIIDFSIRPITDEDGNVVRLIPEGRDITDLKKREQELKRYQAFTQATNSTFVTIDESTTIQSVNPAVEETFGYEPEELIGEKLTVLMSEPAAEQYRAAFQQYLETDEKTTNWNNVETTGERRGGETIPLAVSFSEVTVEGDRWFVGSINDITERKQREEKLQDAHAQLENAIEAGVTGTWEWHIQEDRLVTGREFAETFGVDPDQAQQGVELDRFISQIYEDDREQVEQQIESAIAECDDYEAEYRVWDADNELRWVLARGYVESDENGKPVRFPGAIIDITDRKQTEQELQQHIEYLEEFVGVVSHDLRNPLNVVKGRIGLVQKDCDSEHFDAIESAAERMNRIIDGLLRLAREGRDIGSLDTVFVEDVINDAFQLVADDADQATLQYADEDLAGKVIEADRERLAQVFENLFRNAIEHEGEDVTVSVGCLDNGFYIEDDGSGIPEQDREKVFNVAYSTRGDGSGFGLHIVEQIINAHGWDIRVTEGSLGGARFEVTGLNLSSE